MYPTHGGSQVGYLVYPVSDPNPTEKDDLSVAGIRLRNGEILLYSAADLLHTLQTTPAHYDSALQERVIPIQVNGVGVVDVPSNSERELSGMMAANRSSPPFVDGDDEDVEDDEDDEDDGSSSRFVAYGQKRLPDNSWRPRDNGSFQEKTTAQPLSRRTASTASNTRSEQSLRSVYETPPHSRREKARSVAQAKSATRAKPNRSDGNSHVPRHLGRSNSISGYGRARASRAASQATGNDDIHRPTSRARRRLSFSFLPEESHPHPWQRQQQQQEQRREQPRFGSSQVTTFSRVGSNSPPTFTMPSWRAAETNSPSLWSGGDAQRLLLDQDMQNMQDMQDEEPFYDDDPMDVEEDVVVVEGRVPSWQQQPGQRLNERPPFGSSSQLTFASARSNRSPQFLTMPSWSANKANKTKENERLDDYDYHKEEDEAAAAAVGQRLNERSPFGSSSQLTFASARSNRSPQFLTMPSWSANKAKEKAHSDGYDGHEEDALVVEQQCERVVPLSQLTFASARSNRSPQFLTMPSWSANKAKENALVVEQQCERVVPLSQLTFASARSNRSPQFFTMPSWHENKAKEEAHSDVYDDHEEEDEAVVDEQQRERVGPLSQLTFASARSNLHLPSFTMPSWRAGEANHEEERLDEYEGHKEGVEEDQDDDDEDEEIIVYIGKSTPFKKWPND